mgnify:CR=1 FL=1
MRRNVYPPHQSIIRPRTGSAALGLLGMVAGIATLAGAAFFFAVPIQAAGALEGQVSPELPQRIKTTLRQLQQLAGASAAVLHSYIPTNDDPFTELVVWIDDTNGSGAPEPLEVGVLSHNTVLDSIVWYPPQMSEAVKDLSDPISARNICRTRRQSVSSSRQIFAQAISDVAFNWCNTVESREELLEITLTWPVKGADGHERASKHVHVRRIDSIDWSDE